MTSHAYVLVIILPPMHQTTTDLEIISQVIYNCKFAASRSKLRSVLLFINYIIFRNVILTDEQNVQKSERFML